MQLSANTQVKTIEGHYTGHFKAVVTCAAPRTARLRPLPLLTPSLSLVCAASLRTFS